MQQKQEKLLFVIPLLLFIIAGCRAQFSNRYLQADEIEPVLFSQSSPDGIWQSDDVTVSYSIDSYKPLFVLSGTLHLNSSMLMSYPVLISFFARIHFLDAAGNPLMSSPIHINSSYHTFAEEEYSFRFSQEIPIHVEAFTFSYSGRFSDYGERFPDTTFIDYSPIIRQDKVKPE